MLSLTTSINSFNNNAIETEMANIVWRTTGSNQALPVAPEVFMQYLTNDIQSLAERSAVSDMIVAAFMADGHDVEYAEDLCMRLEYPKSHIWNLREEAKKNLLK